MCCWITSSPCGTKSRAPKERFPHPVPAQAPPGAHPRLQRAVIHAAAVPGRANGRALPPGALNCGSFAGAAFCDAVLLGLLWFAFSKFLQPFLELIRLLSLFLHFSKAPTASSACGRIRRAFLFLLGFADFGPDAVVDAVPTRPVGGGQYFCFGQYLLKL